MIYILTDIAVEDLPKFISVFSTRGAKARGQHGNLHTQLYKFRDEENRLIALFQWESREAFEGFRNDPMVKETMKSSGITRPPEFTFLEKIAEFPS